MEPTKRALLISSPYGGLTGTNNDVDTITKVLEAKNFVLMRCCGSDATQEGIRLAWKDLINETAEEDTVFIYYSGHGGELISEEAGYVQRNWHQFIVPVDYSLEPNNFRGILDIELSSLLRDITSKTHNVSVVLDCCHSGRMARDPHHGRKATPKNISAVRGFDIRGHVDKLQQEGHLKGDYTTKNNPHVVLVAAAAASETAWEHELANGKRVGVLTEALILALEEAGERDVPWRTLLLRVRELVGANFPRQHPQVDGCHNRLPFSLKEIDSTELLVKLENGIPKIQAGLVGGVCEGNIYDIMPFGTEPLESSLKIAEATADRVSGFRSTLRLNFCNEHDALPKEGALAFLKSEALYKWPVVIRGQLPHLEERLSQSKFLRNMSEDENSTGLVTFTQEKRQLIVANSQGVQISCHEFSRDIPPPAVVDSAIKSSEKLARAQHLLSLQCEGQLEVLQHDVYIEFGFIVNGERRRLILSNGQDLVPEDSRVYFHLHNLAKKSTVFVSVFDIQADGEISSVSASTTGIELPPGVKYTIEDQESAGSGLLVSWPSDIPRLRPVGETLVIIISSEAADLQYLVTPQGFKKGDRRTASQRSQLENRFRSVSYSELRGIGAESRGNRVCYDVIQIPFMIQPKLPQLTGESSSLQQQLSSLELDSVSNNPRVARDVPEPETTQEWLQIMEIIGLDANASGEDIAPKSWTGAISRLIQGIPPCIWVINEHTEEITVVVSRHRPSRLMSDVGLGVSSTGANLNFSTSTFVGPATKKTLRPQKTNPESSKAMFPFFSSRDDFGVISIFVGLEKNLYIENDRVDVGVTAIFRNAPDLVFEKYRRHRSNESN